jgi:hypothetical protein
MAEAFDAVAPRAVDIARAPGSDTTFVQEGDQPVALNGAGQPAPERRGGLAALVVVFAFPV